MSSFIENARSILQRRSQKETEAQIQGQTERERKIEKLRQEMDTLIDLTKETGIVERFNQLRREVIGSGEITISIHHRNICLTEEVGRKRKFIDNIHHPDFYEQIKRKAHEQIWEHDERYTSCEVRLSWQEEGGAWNEIKAGIYPLDKEISVRGGSSQESRSLKIEGPEFKEKLKELLLLAMEESYSPPVEYRESQTPDWGDWSGLF